ncbi:MAG: UDP-glucose 4-epimerase [Promethearchaeota archaeon CR_4]|nr:MAG: UDP-glucose 4-epimerase [Candidatus Lokiarchaeota archaeon CR_4]
MKVLITGVTGFIGSHLINRLINDGRYTLAGMARSKEKCRDLAAKGVEIRCADLVDPNSIKGITQGIDVVIHLAAMMRFHAPWVELHRHNVDGTKVLAEDALIHHVKHFIYVSTTETIGPVTNPPGDENSPYNPTYDYGRTKMESELWLQQQYQEKGFPITIIRPTGVLGPGDHYVSLSTIRAIAQGKLSMMPGKADKYVHFTYVDDVVEGILKVLDNPGVSIGETFIIAGDQYVTYKDQLAMIAKLTGVQLPKRSVPIVLAKMYVKMIEWRNKRKGIDDFFWHTSLVNDMTVHRAYSNAKAKKILGFRPRFTLERGLEKTIQYYKEQHLI